MFVFHHKVQLKSPKMPLSELHRAVKSRNLEQLESLLTRGGHNVNNKDNKEITPLLLASKKKNSKEMIEILIKHGADVNAEDESYETALHNAIRIKNNNEVVKLLIQNGAKVNVANVEGTTPLHCGVYVKSNFESVKFLIEQGAKVTAKDHSGMTALHMAADQFDTLELAKLLIEKGANVNSNTEMAGTPLHVAVANQNSIDFVKLLLDSGADVNAERAPELIPLMANTIDDNFEINLLLDYGTDVTRKCDQKGLTALHGAALLKNSTKVIRLLVEHGAEVNSFSNIGITPLYNAVFYDHMDNLELLLNLGASAFWSDPMIERILQLKNPQTSKSMNMVFNHLIKRCKLNINDEQIVLSLWAERFKIKVNRQYDTIFEAEAKKMREELICADRTISFADILTKSLREVAVYLNVEDVKKRLEETDFTQRFPFYSGMFEERIKLATKLAEFLTKSRESLARVLGDCRLPQLFLESVLNYLGEDDIKELNKV